MNGHDIETASPGDSNMRRTTSTIVRQRLETELLAVHEKMPDLHDLERSSRGATAGSGTRGVLGMISMHSSSRRGSPDMQAQLEDSREQINMLVTRMHALEANANSAYEEGLSNEPPPAYV
jgi:BMFP domain-containing protein YqiC